MIVDPCQSNRSRFANLTRARKIFEIKMLECFVTLNAGYALPF